jgi:hypothetical protein
MCGGKHALDPFRTHGIGEIGASGAVAVSVFVARRRAVSIFKLLNVDPSTILGYGSDCLRKSCIGFFTY